LLTDKDCREEIPSENSSKEETYPEASASETMNEFKNTSPLSVRK